MWFILWIKLVTKRPGRLRVRLTSDVGAQWLILMASLTLFFFLNKVIFPRKDRGGGDLQDEAWTLLVVSMPLLSLLVIETCYSEEWLWNLLAAGFLQRYVVTLKLDLKFIPPHINKALLATPQTEENFPWEHCRIYLAFLFHFQSLFLRLLYTFSLDYVVFF